MMTENWNCSQDTVKFLPKSYFTFAFLRHVLVSATVKRGNEQRVIKTVSVFKT
jgi:hypothetical protein